MKTSATLFASFAIAGAIVSCSSRDETAAPAPSTRSATTSATTPASGTPDPNLSPSDVVRVVVEALGHNDAPYPDAGIATTFNFASPENKKMTGPLERFTPIVKAPAYRPLLEYFKVEYGQAALRGDHAQVLVLLTDEDGQQNNFVFILSRQTEGELKGCWMTDGVLEIGVGDPLPEFPTTEPADELNHGLDRV